MERRLAAILFTDVVGYTAVMGRDEAAGRRVRARHEALVRQQVARYHGQWIEEKGDEALSVFHSALDAVNCALAIQSELAGDTELQLRIGIHLGDVTVEGGRVFGDGVNVAARIRPLAKPGRVVVSGLVHDQIRNQKDLEAAPLGEQPLKNVATPVPVWTIAGTPGEPGQRPSGSGGRVPLVTALAAAVLAAAAVAWWWRADSQPAVGTTPIRSIAVLPLEDLSDVSGQEYLSFGMTEALITELAKLDGLRVISRTSMTRYEDTTLPITQIAQELGVDGIVEGSLLRSGNQVRITAQLIDARADSHVWAASYDRDLGDVLALQLEVAREIAREVELEVSEEPRVASAGRRPMSPEAYEAYLKGYYFMMKRTRDDTLRALRYMHEVIRLEPEHPLGYSGLADEYSCAPTHSWSIAESELWPSVPREMIARARENAQRAVELDPLSGAAHTSVALVRMFGDWDWPGAEKQFRKAIGLEPGRAWAHSTYGLLLAFRGHFDEALHHYEEALALDPLRPETTMDVAAVHAWMGEPEAAYRWWKKAEEIDPVYTGLHQAVVIGFCGTQHHAEAMASLETATAKYPDDPLVLGEMAYCHAVSGDRERARMILARIEGLGSSMYVSPVRRALVHVALGEPALAFAALEQGLSEGDFHLLYLGVDKTWDPLRDDPRFAEILGRIGLRADHRRV